MDLIHLCVIHGLQKSRCGYGFTDYSLLLALSVDEILDSQVQLNSVNDLWKRCCYSG